MDAWCVESCANTVKHSIEINAEIKIFIINAIGFGNASGQTYKYFFELRSNIDIVHKRR